MDLSINNMHWSASAFISTADYTPAYIEIGQILSRIFLSQAILRSEDRLLVSRYTVDGLD